MQYQQSPQNELLNYLRQNSAAVEDDRKLEEINDLLTYSQQLEEKEDKRLANSRNIFMVLGALLAFFGLASLPGINWFFDNDPIYVFGILTMLAGGVYTLSRLQSNPLNNLLDRLKQLHARLVKPERKAKPKGIYKSRRDKIIAGVAGGIARRLGIKPGIMRLLFLVSIPITSGASVFLYLLLAVGLSFLPPSDDDR